jgi:hypothetical protein
MAEKVEKIVYSPIVSTDSVSPEAKLMRSAKELEEQSNTDTKYDAVVERFQQNQSSTKPLLGVAVALLLLLAGSIFAKRR